MNIWTHRNIHNVSNLNIYSWIKHVDNSLCNFRIQNCQNDGLLFQWRHYSAWCGFHNESLWHISCWKSPCCDFGPSNSFMEIQICIKQSSWPRLGVGIFRIMCYPIFNFFSIIIPIHYIVKIPIPSLKTATFQCRNPLVTFAIIVFWYMKTDRPRINFLPYSQETRIISRTWACKCPI